MKAHIDLLVILITMFCLPLSLVGQTVGTTYADSSIVMRFRIYYPVNKTDIHEDYMDNATQLHHIRKYLEKSPQIDSITIYSYASPEGSYALNKRLARERGKTAKQYLLKQIPAERQIPDSLIIIDPTAENWQGLRDLVFYQYTHDDKDEILSILDRTDITDERRKVLLKRLNRGKSWQYLLQELMPQLRYATWVSVWQRLQVDKVVAEPTRLEVQLPVMEEPHFKPVSVVLPPVQVKEDTLTWAVKSNLLFDALTALNVEVEIPIKNHWSVMVEHVFPWWETGNKYCLQLLETGVEGRYWFSDNRWHSQKLQGHFVGLYAMSGKYDLQWDEDLCYQGKGWSAGVTYGYSMPVAKWCHLEFALSVGYLRTRYQHYQPSPDYEHLYRDPGKAGNLSVVGPTKLKVSLVVPINLTWRAER